MLGLGWTEMLVIGVAALIFIGPKDLPVVMKRLGQLTGQIRRMGNEFQREINKTTGLDEVRNLRNAITAPLKQTTDQIRKDFNAMSASGEVKPSGLIKPADPKAESVVAEIHAAAGITPPVAKPAPKKAPVRAKAAPTKRVTSKALKNLGPVPEAAPAEEAPGKKPRTRKPAVAKAASVEVAETSVKPTPKPRAPRKPKAPAATAGTK